MAGVITKTNDRAKKAVIERFINVFIIYPHVNGKGSYASETYADHKKNYNLSGSPPLGGTQWKLLDRVGK
tara:strand:+ start:295 stop:504 length:210 start_codon:yes stop_codon:yes gene_type:complete